MIKGILFDFGGTLALGDLNQKQFRSNLSEYIHRLGFRGTESQINKLSRGMFERLMRARSHNREIRLEDLYRSMFFKLGLHPEIEILDYIHKLYIHSFTVELVACVEEVLEYLYERYHLAIVSNSMSNVAREAIKKRGLERYFDTIVISRDLGVRKPDPEIFMFTLNNLGLNNYEVIHVGDSFDDDIQGAKRAGMKAIWITNKSEKANNLPDFIINSLKELTLIL